MPVTLGSSVLRLVVSARTALARLAASIGRTYFAAIDELARAIATFDNYSTPIGALVPIASMTARVRTDAPDLRHAAPALSTQVNLLL